jgi:hypothetical protein
MQSTIGVSRNLRLGDILVEQGIISKDQLGESLQYQKETGARLGEALIELGHVTPAQLEQVLSWQSAYGIDAVTEIIPNPSALGVLTEKFAAPEGVSPRL